MKRRVIKCEGGEHNAVYDQSVWAWTATKGAKNKTREMGSIFSEDILQLFIIF
jgi:hypothetical protein